MDFSNRRRFSRPPYWSLGDPLSLLIMACVLAVLLTWAGAPKTVRANVAHATPTAMVQGTLPSGMPAISVATAPQGIATALQPPMQFEPNLGQTDPQVRFMARGVGYTVFLTPTEAVLVLPTGEPHPDADSGGGTTSGRSKQIIQLQVLGANRTPTIQGLEETPTTIHRLLGTDPTHWQTHVPVYAQVRYDAIYPGIDLVYYGNQQQLEYDFIVHPGADPAGITLGIQGANYATLEADGHLLLSLPGGTLRLQKPMLSQTVDGKTTDIPGHFLLRDPTPTDAAAPIQVAFAVGAYDPTLPLIIDPLVNYANAFGGEGHDIGEAITVDNAGHGYVVGTTESFTFPVTPQAFQNSAVPGRDVFVTKFDTDTSEILFSTYIGGEGDDRATGVAVDANGIPYVTGETTSLTFPTQDAFQDTLHGPSDAFVLKLSTDGSSLHYSTYLGGSGPDHANGIVVNEQGQAALTGSTSSPDFSMMNASDNILGHGEAVPQSDVFVSTLNAQGSALLFSTYLGGAGADVGHSLTVDTEGALYLTGQTSEGLGFPVTTGAFQSTYGGGATDAFIVKLNPGLTGAVALQYASYLGGSGQDVGLDLLVDTQQQAFITGWTTGHGEAALIAAPSPTPTPNSSVSAWGRRSGPSAVGKPTRGFRGLMRDFVQQEQDHTPPSAQVSPLIPPSPLPEFPVTPNAYDATFNGRKDAFLAHVDVAASGPTALVYATYIGGSQSETGFAIGIDSLGRLCIAGTTNSPDYPVNNPLANQHTLSGGTDGFVTKFETDLTTLLFSSFLGGSGDENLMAMRLDAKDFAYLTGQTHSTDFPLLATNNDTVLTEEAQAFIVKVQDPADISATLVPSATYLHLGDDYTWTLNWENNGPDPATEVQVVFAFEQPSLSPSLQFKSIQNISGPSSIITSSCSGSAQSGPGGTLTCDVTDIPFPGTQSSAELTFSPVLDSEFFLSVDMSGLEVDPVQGNNGNSITGTIGVDPNNLTVNFLGSGTGRIEGTPGPSSNTVNILDNATIEYTEAISTVILAATPTGLGNNASTFNGWSGECADTSGNQCTVRLTADRTVSALFELTNQVPMVNAGPDQAITLPGDATLNGTVTDDDLPAPPTLTTTWNEVSGPGTVTFANAALVDTTASFSQPGTYVLRLTADDGALSDSDNVTVTVIPIQRTLTTTATTNGTISGPGIDCGSDCTEIVDDGTEITLTATAAANVNFTGWTVSGSPAASCPGTSTCTVTLDTNRTVTANFGAVQRTLTATTTGNGSGTVTGSGINCGSDCTASVDIDSSITLTATPTANSTFTGWTVTGSPASSCPGTGTCTVTLNTNRTVTATFAIIQRTLTVTTTGSGTGSVQGTGIDCGSDCSHTADDGTQVTLTATPNPSFFFTGWAVSGSPTVTCPGTGTCTITLDINRTVTATFAANQPPVVEAGQLQVVNLPTGSTLPVDVSLNGTITDDGLPPPASLTSLWRLVTGPAVIPDIANNAMPTISFPAIGSYVLELSATDGALSHNDTVTITINDPSSTQVLIPNVVGQPQAGALNALTTVGLTGGTITQELNALVPSGSVIRQTPVGGELGNPGMPVNLVISSGNDLLITIPVDGPDATPGNGICETSPGNGTCSLRAAIQEANAFPGQQTITLTPETYRLTMAGANEDAAATGDLDITDDLIIESSTGNATQIIISGNAIDRVLDLPPGSSPSVTLRGLTIQEGVTEGSTGGGLRNAQGTLTLENSVITNNQSNGSGGGLSHLGGTLTLRNTQVTNNLSEGLGGGLQAQNGTVTINGNSQFRGNSANFGGGLSVGRANGTVTDTLIENNTAIGVGGGIYKFLSPSDLLGGTPTFEVQLSNTNIRNNIPNNCEGNLSGC